MMDENQLIGAAQTGDVASFNALVRAYQQQVYSTAYRILGNSEVAADATQEAFISAFRNVRAFRGGSFRAWLLRIVTNAAYDQLRYKQRTKASSLEEWTEDPDGQIARIQAPDETPEEHAERRELDAMLQRALQALSPDMRLTLVLSDIDGLSHQEIVDITGVNPGTVKSRLARARAQVREWLLAQDEVLPARYKYATEKKAKARSAVGADELWRSPAQGSV